MWVPLHPIKIRTVIFHLHIWSKTEICVLLTQQLENSLKTERNPGIWFSLSYHSFLLLKRSDDAKALEAVIFPSVAVRCTTHISLRYPESNGLLHKAHHHIDLPVRRSSALSATASDFEPENSWKEDVVKKRNDKHCVCYIVLLFPVFFITSDLTFLLIRGTDKMLYQSSDRRGFVLLNNEFMKL